MGPKLVALSIAITAIVLVVAWFGDQTGAHLYGLPLMAAMALGVFAIQWVGLIHARLFETEHYFDLVGSLTYITVTLLAIQQAADIGLRQQLIVNGETQVGKLKFPRKVLWGATDPKVVQKRLVGVQAWLNELLAVGMQSVRQPRLRTCHYIRAHTD